MTKKGKNKMILALISGLLLLATSQGWSASSVTLEWDAVTTDIDGNSETIATYRLFQANKSLLNLTTTEAQADTSITKIDVSGSTTSQTVSGLTEGIQYFFRLTAIDLSGNQSGFNVGSAGEEAEVSTTVPVGSSGDTTAPAVAITNPTDGATVSGIVTITATASDSGGVTGVQFRVSPGVNLAVLDTAAPYTASWDTRGAANGNYTINAQAWDTAGNTATSSISVTVSNPVTLTYRRVPDPNLTYLIGNLVYVSVNIQGGANPAVTLLHTDICAPTNTACLANFNQSVTMNFVEVDSSNGARVFAGYINTASLTQISGTVAYYARVTDGATTVTAATGTFQIVHDKITVGDSGGGQYIAVDPNPDDGSLKVDISPAPEKSGVSRIIFELLDPALWEARGDEEGINFGHGRRAVRVYGVSVEGQQETVFSQPVTLTLVYPDSNGDGVVDGTTINESDLRIFWFNKTQGRWVAMGGIVNPADNTLTVLTSHFSAFGMFPSSSMTSDGKAKEKFLSPTLVDGFNDMATFGMEAQEVSIVDVFGRMVFHSFQQGGSAIAWHCRDDQGNIVDSGVYIAKIKNTAGGTTYQSFAVVK